MEQNGRNKSRGYPVKAYILGAAIIIFFIGCIGAMFYFSKRKPIMCAFILGLFFTVFGLFGVTSSIKMESYKKDHFIFLFPTVGLGILIYSSIYMWRPNLISEKCAPLLILFLFILAGGWMVLSPVAAYIGKKEKYTVVTAKCTGLDEHISDHKGILYAPIFTYCYNEKEYSTKLDFYSNIDISKVGTYEDIYINPYNPREIYRPSLKQSTVEILFGIIFLACSIAGLYMYIIK